MSISGLQKQTNANIQAKASIANAITTRFEKTDHLIQIKQAKIEKLEQYKKSLIYEYVTGKEEVVNG